MSLPFYFEQLAPRERLILRPEMLSDPHYISLHDFFTPRRAVHNSVHNSDHKKDDKKFHVCLDVNQFSPDEIVVKTIGNKVVIEGKHEEKEDEHGYIMRHFVRKYVLPEGQDPNDVVSSVSSDGFLTITAPRDPIILPDKNERIVPIMQTGIAHREVREHRVEHLPEARKHHVRKPQPQPTFPLAIKYIQTFP